MVSPGQGWLEVGTPVKVIVQAGIMVGFVLGLCAKSVLHFGHYVATATPRAGKMATPSRLCTGHWSAAIVSSGETLSLMN